MTAHGCTVVMGVPTMYLALLDAAGRDPRPPLERAYSGGSSLPPAVLRRVEEVLGAPVYEGYGLTETSPSVSYHQPGHERRAGTVGLPIPGVEVGIAAADEPRRIRLLPAGERGAAGSAAGGGDRPLERGTAGAVRVPAPDRLFTEAFPVGPTGKILKAELAGFFR
ncbi:AMP-binding protein [Streptomyces sp. 3211.6]|uniref:AMP-binding protein n=1 Tax=Streptomyces sp. 3211.6 TaxID=1938845 RepID=UPI002905733C|nr:AMP-binding protein [Streptomyces sp. 3211.6]